jgi:hypothetical protein
MKKIDHHVRHLPSNVNGHYERLIGLDGFCPVSNSFHSF